MEYYNGNTDAYEIDVLGYLEGIFEGLPARQQLQHYQVLKPALFHLKKADPAAFDIALKEITRKLGIKAKAVRDDLTGLDSPSDTTKDALTLLEKMGQTRPLRLAQDYQGEQLWFGVVAGEDRLLVNSNRELLTLDKIPEHFAVKDNGFDLCQFSKEGIVRFLGGTEEEGSALLVDLRNFFLRFAVFRDKRVASLLATWALGTYCYQIFRVFPYLALRSPDKRCGKSRVLDLLSLLAFNASPKTTNPTEAQLFRSPSRNGGTMLLDEIENLGAKDSDTYKGVLAVLNSGFEKNGTVERQVKDANGNFVGARFETFCPYAIAGINKTAATLEDRSIFVIMARRLKSEKTERFTPHKLESEVQALRDRSYIWALTHAEDVSSVYDLADKYFPALEPLDDRARDLWEPLISIAAVADATRGDSQRTLTEELISLAQDLSQVRDGAAEDSNTVQVVKSLHVILSGRQEAFLPPTELAKLLKENLNWEKLSTRGLASLMNPLGLYSNQTRQGDKVLRAYHLRSDLLDELTERYAQNSE